MLYHTISFLCKAFLSALILISLLLLTPSIFAQEKEYGPSSEAIKVSGETYAWIDYWYALHNKDLLIKGLREKYWRAPGNAAMSLASKFKGDDVFEALSNALGFREYGISQWCISLRAGIAAAFGILGDKKAVPLLTQLLETDSKDSTTYINAAESLANLMGKEALGTIIQHLNKDSRYGVRTSLTGIVLRLNGIGSSPLNRGLRHEVARLIVWHVIRTRPAVPSAVSYEVRQQGNALLNALGHSTHSHPTGTKTVR